MSKEKVVVFGGAGFLGSHVVNKLSSSGFEVVSFDKRESGYLGGDYDAVVGDILDPEQVRFAVQGASYVYNFAALADLNKAVHLPIETIKQNILGNAIILNACVECGVKRFVYASTVYVYSRNGGFYKVSKLAAESYIEEFHEAFGINYTILRYGSLYGPRSNQDNGLYRIVRRALETGIVSYDGHRDSLREYIHIDDAAIASVSAIGERYKNESLVITGQEPMRVEDLLKRLAEILNIKKPIEFQSSSAADSHYILTPYSYAPKKGKKYIPRNHTDLGAGLLELIESISYEIDIGSRD